MGLLNDDGEVVVELADPRGGLMDDRLMAGACLIITEYGEAGLARLLLDFIDQQIPYRSDTDDDHDQANWRIVKGLREVRDAPE